MNSLAETDVRVHERYLEALETEIKLLSFSSEGIRFETVYLGGGTPTILSTEQLARLFTVLYKNFDCKKAGQVMVEASPSTVTLDKIKVLKSFGVNKITLGIQTGSAAVLERLDRTGQMEAVVRAAYRAIRAAGIKYVNIELIAGLPCDSCGYFFKSLDLAMKLKPDTIHIDSFYPGPATRYFQEGHRLDDKAVNSRTRLVNEAIALMRKKCPGAFERHGDPKENMQFYLCKKMRAPVPGLGWGATAHAVGYLQYEKKGTVGACTEALSRGKFPEVSGAAMDQNTEMRAYAVTCVEGVGFVSKADFKNIFGRDFYAVFRKEISQLAKLGLLSEEPSDFRLNRTDTARRILCAKLFYGPAAWRLLKKKLPAGAPACRGVQRSGVSEVPQNPDFFPGKSVLQGPARTK